MKITLEQLENFFGNDNIKEQLLKALNGDYPISVMKQDIIDYNEGEEE